MEKVLILNVLSFAVKQYSRWEFISGNDTTHESLVLAVIAAKYVSVSLVA